MTLLLRLVGVIMIAAGEGRLTRKGKHMVSCAGGEDGNEGLITRASMSALACGFGYAPSIQVARCTVTSLCCDLAVLGANPRATANC